MLMILIRAFDIRLFDAALPLTLIVTLAVSSAAFAQQPPAPARKPSTIPCPVFRSPCPSPTMARLSSGV